MNMKTSTIIVFLILYVGTLDVTSTKSCIRQKRAWIIDTFTIEEEHPGPFPYVLGIIELDRKYLVQFLLHGSGVDEDPKGILSINRKTGEIYVKGKVDYESFRTLRLGFEARNASDNKLDTRLGIEVQIQDVNDHAPLFQSEKYETTIEESTLQGTPVVMVMASDGDLTGTDNGTFTFRIVLVTPSTPNVEFFIKQTDLIGTISFKGCLDYEKAQKYTILVEAKDHGEKKKLSSTSTVTVNIEDMNNHLPTFSGQTGTGRVKERDSGVPVLRLQVTDKDSRGSKAWKAKYTIHGDEKEHFKIETDLETNEGVLTVVEPMDYEKGFQRNLSVNVVNEVPYFSCEVKGRPKEGLWDIVTSKDGSSTGVPVLPSQSSWPVTITVEDVNDPPIFIPDVKEVVLMENTEAGQPLEIFTAVDLDGSHANTFQFIKGEDPDGWVSVDPKTGQISTMKVLDRESPYVKDSAYTVTLYAVDNGEPPMTGTGTLTIHLKDENDNVPVLEVNTVDMCLSDEPTMTNISARDLDQPPYSSPFNFVILGDVKGKWRLDPNYGTTVDLVKENTVYAGHHELTLKISDSQGQYLLQNLSVTVCDCSVTPNCHLRRASSSQVGGSAICIMFLALLALLGVMLLACLMTCKTEKVIIPTYEGSGWHLLPSNIEIPGTDCKVPTALLQVEPSHPVKKTSFSVMDTNTVTIKQNKMSQSGRDIFHQEQNSVKQPINKVEQIYSQSAPAPQYEQQQYGWSMNRSSMMQPSYRENVYYQGSMMNRNFSTYNEDTFVLRAETLSTQINQRLFTLQAPWEELGDYEPHSFAYEGEPVVDLQLDAISIPDSDFHPDQLQNLDFRFNTLATICRPDLIEL